MVTTLTFHSTQEALKWALAEIQSLSSRLSSIEGRLAGGRSAFEAVARVAHNAGAFDENELKAILAQQAAACREMIDANTDHVQKVGIEFYEAAEGELRDLSDGIGYPRGDDPDRPQAARARLLVVPGGKRG